MKEVGIDISSYEPYLKESELLGLKWLGFKAVEVDDRVFNWNSKESVDMFCTDPTYLSNWVQIAYNKNIPACAYIFDNPAYKMLFYASQLTNHVKYPNDVDPQMLALRQALKNKTYHAICIDVERWWMSYNDYYKNKNTNPSVIKKIPDIWIRDSAADLFNRIEEDQANGKLLTVPIWIYTGKWFVDAYSPSLDSYLHYRIQWLADYTTPVYTQTKGQFKQWSEVTNIVKSVAYNPKWVGNKPPEMLQLTDNVRLPGIYSESSMTVPHNVDLDTMLVPMDTVFASGRWQQDDPDKPENSPSPSPSAEVPPEDMATLDNIYALELENNELLKQINSKLP